MCMWVCVHTCVCAHVCVRIYKETREAWNKTCREAQNKVEILAHWLSKAKIKNQE